jgi:hypothetical protein
MIPLILKGGVRGVGYKYNLSNSKFWMLLDINSKLNSIISTNERISLVLYVELFYL